MRMPPVGIGVHASRSASGRFDPQLIMPPSTPMHEHGPPCTGAPLGLQGPGTALHLVARNLGVLPGRAAARSGW